jgi:phage tail-like protein
MADPTKTYPLPKFHFQVSWGKTRMGFTEVTGLDFETEVIEYREGNMKQYNKLKQPGLTKYGNITLKRGTFLGDFDYYTWWKQTYFFQEKSQTFRTNVTIQLMDEQHNPIVTWTLANAWPTKVQSTDLKADANEVAIESIELAHEGLTITEAK